MTRENETKKIIQGCVNSYISEIDRLLCSMARIQSNLGSHRDTVGDVFSDAAIDVRAARACLVHAQERMALLDYKCRKETNGTESE